MQLKNDEQSWNEIRDVIRLHYGSKDTSVIFFEPDELKKNNELEIHFLLARRHVVKYSFGEDRKIYLGMIFLAIGPHYFRPAYFWDYENSQRFSIEASTEAVEQNLALLDEFLGIETAVS